MSSWKNMRYISEAVLIISQDWGDNWIDICYNRRRLLRLCYNISSERNNICIRNVSRDAWIFCCPCAALSYSAPYWLFWRFWCG